MARIVLLSAVLLFTALAVEAGKRRNKQCQKYPSSKEFDECYTCSLFKPREVTLVIRNVLRDPTFEESVTLNCTRFNTLFYMLQEAAQINTAFRFSGTYFGATLGFFIDAINDVIGTYDVDESFWSILDGDLNFTPVGVSNYQPDNGETVTFNFTQGGHP